MATQVAGELYYDLDGQMLEIKRQLRQKNGYPFNPQELQLHLQAAVEGRFKPIERVHVIISETEIMVNLDAPPALPFDGAQIEFQTGGGWVKVEKREDELYVNGRKIIFYLSERQQGNNMVRGHELREELSGKPVLHPNIMDALIEYPNFIPEGWKVDESGNIRFIFFWAVIFRDAGGRLYVRYFCFHVGQWRRRSCHWLDDNWGDRGPAALLASI
ncbi:hypothetical protein COU01_04345 [Candidatus Falkowbacteria bacterium CG10_big_fil_rev_8_21_14_0_10_44_15]|uniref:Uncharacterized protein n=1 Tax=Candidatus Falkowbacteria bacterium CG10_big_fil_rev_8_21_14_0_10_44_15 TaxID=1974569 RepID=A0A2H0UYR3_9BACT|nr:MAG: hypothetical protein COU01_04345 [Candidatus Falkowbacteria bacterium CG10_big_fil_rev_8_21_14_0_10_44_15]